MRGAVRDLLGHRTAPNGAQKTGIRLLNLQGLLCSLGGPLVAARGCADPSAAHDGRAAREASGRNAGELLLAPVPEACAEKAGLDAEGFADRLEGEGTVALFAAEPLLSLGEKPLTWATLRVGVVLKAPKRVLQNCRHQAFYRSDTAVVAPRIIVLLGR